MQFPYFVPTGTKRPRQSAPNHKRRSLVVHKCALRVLRQERLAALPCAVTVGLVVRIVVLRMRVRYIGIIFVAAIVWLH